jgi:hypothetical protein
MIYHQNLGPYVLMQIAPDTLDETQETFIANIAVAQYFEYARDKRLTAQFVLVESEFFLFIKEYDYRVFDRRVFAENSAVAIRLEVAFRASTQVSRMENKMFEINWRQYDD